mmetsp:Transcript_8732/g.27481  ORF Transcript_8732/g.27481 Transcript_8732/m.27481 type:complete len:299 (-) Transcript_8732:131-1027(-)
MRTTSACLCGGGRSCSDASTRPSAKLTKPSCSSFVPPIALLRCTSAPSAGSSVASKILREKAESSTTATKSPSSAGFRRLVRGGLVPRKAEAPATTSGALSSDRVVPRKAEALAARRPSGALSADRVSAWSVLSASSCSGPNSVWRDSKSTTSRAMRVAPICSQLPTSDRSSSSHCSPHETSALCSFSRVDSHSTQAALSASPSARAISQLTSGSASVLSRCGLCSGCDGGSTEECLEGVAEGGELSGGPPTRGASRSASCFACEHCAAVDSSGSPPHRASIASNVSASSSSSPTSLP